MMIDRELLMELDLMSGDVCWPMIGKNYEEISARFGSSGPTQLHIMLWGGAAPAWLPAARGSSRTQCSGSASRRA
jgi:hypothetical protein